MIEKRERLEIQNHKINALLILLIDSQILAQNNPSGLESIQSINKDIDHWMMKRKSLRILFVCFFFV